MIKKIFLTVMLLSAVIINTGCVQEKNCIPVATITGRIIVPGGKVATGVKVRIAGEGDYGYADESGRYSIEVRKGGKFLLMARGKDFDINYAWVDCDVEETAEAPDIKLNSKVVGEALWMASVIDYEDAVSFSVKSDGPYWQTAEQKMYDDGTHGDILAGDGIFALRLTNLLSGYQKYTMIVEKGDGSKDYKYDNDKEGSLDGKSVIYIAESSVRTVSGYVTSPTAADAYAGIKVATNKGARSTRLDSSGHFTFDVQGDGTEYLVFRSARFDVKAVPINLSTSSSINIGETKMEAKKPGRIKLVCVRSEFTDANENPPIVMCEFTGWRKDQMFDDGTYGDDVANDGIYTRVYEEVPNLGGGMVRYQFSVNGVDKVRDPYEEGYVHGSDGDFSTISVIY